MNYELDLFHYQWCNTPGIGGVCTSYYSFYSLFHSYSKAASFLSNGTFAFKAEWFAYSLETVIAKRRCSRHGIISPEHRRTSLYHHYLATFPKIKLCSIFNSCWWSIINSAVAISKLSLQELHNLYYCKFSLCRISHYIFDRIIRKSVHLW